ncbi:MAG TPA: hypothetical protein VIZ28_07455 [Chitinophagaceae bacterium]
MRKIILLAVLVMSSRLLFAQVEKGNLLIGGKIGFSSESNSEDDDYKLSRFVFKPNVGYFFMNKLAAGIRGSIESGKYYDDSYSDVLIGPFVRYYLLAAAMKTNILIDACYKFGSEKDGTSDSYGKNQFAISAGPAFFISRCFAIEMLLQYSTLKYSDFSDKYNKIAFVIGFQLFLAAKKEAAIKTAQ